MAQGAIAPGLTNGIKTLTIEELHEIQECEKIVRFRDAILAGTHPRIHVPAHLVARPRQTSPIQPPSINRIIPGESISTTPIPSEDSKTPSSKISNAQWSPAGRSATSVALILGKAGVSEINPILLEKSDELKKAEINLKRQRLERALREQVEQKRMRDHAAGKTSESLPDFDISEVLSKALSIVQHEALQVVGTHTSTASDSFDENSFYSSQHDTPGLSSLSQEGHDSGRVEVQRQLTTGQSFENATSQIHDESHDVVMTGVFLPKELGQDFSHQPSSSQDLTSTTSHPSKFPGLSSALTEDVQHIQSDSGYEKDAATDSSSQQISDVNSVMAADGVNGNSSKAPQGLTNSSGVQNGEQMKRKFGKITTDSPNFADPTDPTEPAIIQSTSNLSPFAPQPARISPLATARGPPILDQSMIASDAQIGQVVALRKDTAISSPDSSPKGTKEKKKRKKNARKSTGKDSNTVDTPPYIKPERVSPPPFHAAPLPQPRKRQRQAFHQEPELNYDEPSYDPLREEPAEPVVPARYRDYESRQVYDKSEDLRAYEPRQAERGYYRVEEPQYRRVVSHDAYRAPRSPEMYSTTEEAPVSVSSGFAERARPSRYSRSSNIPPGAVHIDLDGEKSRSPVILQRETPLHMAPPSRIAPARIITDEFGRQYYESLPTRVISRQSDVPSSRVVGDEVVYERPLPRAMPRQVAEIYGEDGLMYRRASPAFAPPLRRVVTQPDQDPPYRSYREYSSHPVAMPPPSEGFIRIQAPLRQMSQFEEAAPRQYASRTSSVRSEVPRYNSSRVDEVTREYAPRVSSVRPEALRPDAARYDMSGTDVVPREYVARVGGGHPEAGRYEVSREYERVGSVRPEQRIREYSVRPEQLQGSREFSIRPGGGERQLIGREYPPERYAAARTMAIGGRVVEEVGYLEGEPLRQREILGSESQDMYGDETREVVYR